MTPSPSGITTTGQLRASGHTYRPVRVELRENLLAALAEGRDPWPGIHGFDATVIPQLERAILAGHDIVLLGSAGRPRRGSSAVSADCSTSGRRSSRGRSSASIRSTRSPRHPPCRRAGRRPAHRVAVPQRTVRREARHPDTSVADLIGDVDPIKVAEGRSLGDPETIQYGLVPRRFARTHLA